jgi:hypothetical protein
MKSKGDSYESVTINFFRKKLYLCSPDLKIPMIIYNQQITI